MASATNPPAGPVTGEEEIEAVARVMRTGWFVDPERMVAGVNAL